MFEEEVENGIIVTSWNGLYKLSIAIFWINQKPQKPQKSKLGRLWLNRGRKLLDTFGNLDRDWSLFPGHLSHNSIHKKD